LPPVSKQHTLCTTPQTYNRAIKWCVCSKEIWREVWQSLDLHIRQSVTLTGRVHTSECYHCARGGNCTERSMQIGHQQNSGKENTADCVSSSRRSAAQPQLHALRQSIQQYETHGKQKMHCCYLPLAGCFLLSQSLLQWLFHLCLCGLNFITSTTPMLLPRPLATAREQRRRIASNYERPSVPGWAI